MLHENQSLLIGSACKYKREKGSRGRGKGSAAVTQELILPGELQQSYKDSTRPPPCSTQDEATEGCSAVWGRSNKLLPQSGPAEAFYSVYQAPTNVASVSCCCFGWKEFILCLLWQTSHHKDFSFFY